MKRIIKKNQLIITSLVIMIAVAGYLNFTAEDSLTAVSANQSELTVAKAGDDCSQMVIEADPEEELACVEETGEAQEENEYSETENIEDVSRIGEAVLTGSQAAKGFSAAAKLNREQVRSQTKEMLMEMMNDSTKDASVKKDAADSLLTLNEMSEKEQAAETLLEAKGFKNSVVSITKDSVDVVICLESLDDTQRAQIEDIVKRKVGVSADQIVITTLNE